MRVKDINGRYIGNAIGYCHCPRHEGVIGIRVKNRFYSEEK